MTCHDCTKAATEPWHGFSFKCQGCSARNAARSHHFARVRQAGKLDGEYRHLLQQFGLTHEQVKQAAASDRLFGGS